MENESRQPLPQSTSSPRWSRDFVVEHLFGQGTDGAPLSERAYAALKKIPPSTLRGWRVRMEKIHDDPLITAFFESPAGLKVLNRILVAAHLVITFLGGGGVRLVCTFIELAGLAPYVANSLSVQQRYNTQMESLIVGFAPAQAERLALAMPEQEIAVAQDETFHPAPCLVAIEPVSDYILVEQYEPRRDKGTWDRVMEKALKGLRVKVIQVVSDEAKALISHAVLTLKAVHSPDIFHVLHELFKATALSLFARVRAAERDILQADARIGERLARIEEAQQDKKRHQDLPTLQGQLAWAIEFKTAATKTLEQVKTWQLQLKETIKAISETYHPFSLTDGALQTSEYVSERLNILFDRIRELASETQLPQRSLDGIEKAYRVTDGMLNTLRFVHTTITQRMAAFALPEDVAHLVLHRLIPALYLQRVAKKARGAQKRKALRAISERLLAELTSPDSLFMRLDDTQRTSLYSFAKTCAWLFQPSSSCVEGRNGRLSLFHHGLHRLSPQRLIALTAIHNFFITDSCGRTPAERFFGQPHDSLFDHLVAHMPLPARPAAARPRAMSESLH